MSNLTFWSDDEPMPFRLRNAYVVAPALAIVGTLVGDYGDLIGGWTDISTNGCCSADERGPDFWLIFTPCGYDDPKILRS